MSLPYFPMYPTDFEAKAGHLSLAEDGAYNRLMRLCWLSPKCSIPADPKWIKRRMKVSQDDFDEIVQPVLDEFFKVSGRRGNKRYSNKRLSEEFAQATALHKQRSEAGKRGNASKYMKNKGSPSRKASAKRSQLEPEPEPLKIKNKSGEWVLAAVPDEGTTASALCKIVIGDAGQEIWATWFNGKRVAFDGDVVRPLSGTVRTRLSQKYIQHIERAGMTLGEVWVEGAVA